MRARVCVCVCDVRVCMCVCMCVFVIDYTSGTCVANQDMPNSVHVYHRRSVTRGFICEVVKKYELQALLNNYLNENVIPTKSQWKSVVKNKMLSFETQKWQQRIYNDTYFDYFKKMFHRRPCTDFLETL